MAFTYLILNSLFAACVVFMLAPSLRRPSRGWWGTLAILLVLTLVFDNLIILAGIVEYDPAKLLGLFLGKAPIEDFFYALLAVAIVPLLWRRFDPKKTERPPQ